ncbi:carbohydrate ABC transporter permease [Paracoccus saliphilus]|uniref:Carbohydrate ABC transporter membrane protein 1, CUT1 family n=1 Tax=Paracoccus saliphilus TaxID=405559 RepID=A0AA45W524_9RHOB|nr:sugar ABC transporter permease [Paracoccus saliphilus]WCR02104.1 sugar ABC transporter permease [Paracoccus saliphilus]SIS90041.1 carbohydrate ABC transporter membrane protein 1, CUT1 family [Paracoccus saliphilus]
MSDRSRAPTHTTPLARREARLAWGMMLPTLISVALIVVLPLLAVFWISFKPISLADLRAPTPVISERVRGEGEERRAEYRLRNSSQDKAIRNVVIEDSLPSDLIKGPLPDGCAAEGDRLICRMDEIEGGYNERLIVPLSPDADEDELENGEPVVTGEADNILTNMEFTLKNFTLIFNSGEFMSVLGVTLFYTVFGTLGALVAGMFAAQLLNHSFRFQGILRGLFLFPYVAPVIAVAFSWLILFDPFTGSANALLVQMGVADETINFFGTRPLALIMVTSFEIWRYFPMAFLFILARMQSIDSDMYEAADMDGASPFQKFWYLSLPQLLGILSVLFLLRFIWTFNKFDDIFLLTGGNAGTRTLTVSVYDQAFAVSNIGAGAAVAVVIFGCLLMFSAVFFKIMSREEGL